MNRVLSRLRALRRRLRARPDTEHEQATLRVALVGLITFFFWGISSGSENDSILLAGLVGFFVLAFPPIAAVDRAGPLPAGDQSIGEEGLDDRVRALGVIDRELDLDVCHAAQVSWSTCRTRPSSRVNRTSLYPWPGPTISKVRGGTNER